MKLKISMKVMDIYIRYIKGVSYAGDFWNWIIVQDLQSCAVRFQTELTAVGDKSKSIKGARCLRLTAFNKGCSSRASLQESHEDTLTICSMVWNVWHAKGVDTYMSIFDLNQWYKEQMPSKWN